MLKQLLSSLLLRYFRFFANLQLRKNQNATIIGITGSDGKTSTRLALVHILSSHAIVKHTVHANSQSGIPLSILGLRPRSYTFLDWVRLVLMALVKLLTNWEHYKYFVVEMGIDSARSPGNMAYLLTLVHPQVGIVLNASESHTAGFDYLVKDTSPARRSAKLVSQIAKEKMQLLRSLGERGVAIYNLDQPELVKQKHDIIARHITFGKNPRADLQILPNFCFKYQSQKYTLKLRDIFPPVYAYTFAAALAGAAALGIPPSVSVPLLSDYRSPSGRMRIFKGIRDTTIIDSTYNASPGSMQSSLKHLKALSLRHHKIAVLGDMRELGTLAKQSHKQLADWIMANADEALLLGEQTGLYTLPLLVSAKFPVRHFTKMSDLIGYLVVHLPAGSYVLVKGSQNQIYLERAVEALLKDKNDITRLCRRGPFWDKIRAQNP